MALMGSKTAARDAMERAGVPVLPGYQGEDRSVERLATEAANIGFPILVKADFGGGGKGMRIVRDADDLQDAVAAATREAENAFGNGSVFLERFVDRPRHVEVQVFGDGRGNAVHLFERECSIQRRHQKVVEECPSPGIDDGIRTAICDAGMHAAAAVDYLGAGTVEFLVDPSGAFFFLEMNTRLQVEHPVTEEVCGVDLVAAQLAVAAGAEMPWTQEEIRPNGHSIECRLYAEDPSQGFLPSIGKLLRYQVPDLEFFRHDGGVQEGDEVTPYYDPMLAKLIVWGENREEAVKRMSQVLQGMVVHGVKTNLNFLQHLVNTDAFSKGDFHTRWVDDGVPGWGQDTADVALLLAAAVLSEPIVSRPKRNPPGGKTKYRGPWLTLHDWRLNGGGQA
jgi:acetyl/propionyl-CoA carboxylase alpha subunit